jgi:hypothetical protein
MGGKAAGCVGVVMAVAAVAFGQDAAPAAQPGMRELFPHVRADVAARVIEIDGVVPIDCHDLETPDVFLEVIACTPGSKEHEALVMTKAKASHVHAALLAIGLKSGKPGSWDWDGETLKSVEPEGDRVEVRIAYEKDGERVEVDAREWVVSVEGEKRFDRDKTAGWVFAGSRMVTRGEREVYDADGTGLIVGLTTFGSEVVAWREVISPEAEVQEPEWIADREKVPGFKTEVVLVLKAVKGGDGETVRR